MAFLEFYNLKNETLDLTAADYEGWATIAVNEEENVDAAAEEDTDEDSTLDENDSKDEDGEMSLLVLYLMQMYSWKGVWCKVSS